MKLLITALFLCIFSVAGIAQTKVTDQVRAALDGQVSAWNSGKLENAMGFYHNSENLIWVSRAGIERGYQPILESYLKEFADRSKMGTYTYEPLHIEPISAKSVYYVYRWKIELDGKKLMGGVSSQIWKKQGKRWLIFSEHAS